VLIDDMSSSELMITEKKRLGMVTIRDGLTKDTGMEVARLLAKGFLDTTITKENWQETMCKTMAQTNMVQ
jgi:hypothetical protein